MNPSHVLKPLPSFISALAFAAAVFAPAARAADGPAASDAQQPMPPVVHPALFLVGDSITRTGTPPGDTGPWGMGYEIIPFFDQTKLHVYNQGLGGRSSRLYMEEGAWAKILEQLQPGDFVSVMIAHNDEANSMNYPDRATILGNGEETIQTGFGDARKIIHTYGWYLRKYVAEGKAKGATVILCSPVPRNYWTNGKIRRGFPLNNSSESTTNGHAKWTEEAAKQVGAPFIDLNTASADRFDAIGQELTAWYFADQQHNSKYGARVNAESYVAGIKKLNIPGLSDALLATPPPTRPAPTTPMPARGRGRPGGAPGRAGGSPDTGKAPGM